MRMYSSFSDAMISTKKSIRQLYFEKICTVKAEFAI